MTRKETLEGAIKCVVGERENQYGSPKSNFEVIGDYWGTYLRHKKLIDIKLGAEDVATMLALMKIARLTTGGPKEDTFVDVAGYIACAAEVATNAD